MLEDIVEILYFSDLLLNEFIGDVEGISVFKRFERFDRFSNSIRICIEKP